MRLLLDSNIILWASHEPHRIPKDILDRMNSHEKFVSIVSFWELQIKHSLGKLNFAPIDGQFINKVKSKLKCSIINPDIEHITNLYSLKYYHSDPFDRLLLTQCMVDDLVMISSDKKFNYYHNVKKIIFKPKP